MCYFNSFYMLCFGNTFTIIDNDKLSLYIDKHNSDYFLNIFANNSCIEGLVIENADKKRVIPVGNKSIKIEQNDLLSESCMKINIKNLDGSEINIGSVAFRKFRGTWFIQKPKYLDENVKKLLKMEKNEHITNELDISDLMISDCLYVTKNYTTQKEKANKICDYILSNFFFDKNIVENNENIYFTKKGTMADISKYISKYMDTVGVPNVSFVDKDNCYCLYYVDKKWQVIRFSEECMNIYDKGRYLLNSLPVSISYGLSIEFISQSQKLDFENILT